MTNRKPLSAPSAAPAGEPQTGMIKCESHLFAPGNNYCGLCGEIRSKAVAGDAVPRTPEPDYDAQWKQFRKGCDEIANDISKECDRLSLPYRLIAKAHLIDLLSAIDDAYDNGKVAVTAHEEAEIAQLKDKLAFEKQQQNEGYKVPALQAEVERLAAEKEQFRRERDAADQEARTARDGVERLRKVNEKASGILERPASHMDKKHLSRKINEAIAALGERKL